MAASTTDASVDHVLTYGALPLPEGTPHRVEAVVSYSALGTSGGTFDVALEIVGANNFTDTVTVTSTTNKVRQYNF